MCTYIYIYCLSFPFPEMILFMLFFLFVLNKQTHVIVVPLFVFKGIIFTTGQHNCFLSDQQFGIFNLGCVFCP